MPMKNFMPAFSLLAQLLLLINFLKFNAEEIKKEDIITVNFLKKWRKLKEKGKINLNERIWINCCRISCRHRIFLSNVISWNRCRDSSAAVPSFILSVNFSAEWFAKIDLVCLPLDVLAQGKRATNNQSICGRINSAPLVFSWILPLSSHSAFNFCRFWNWAAKGFQTDTEVWKKAAFISSSPANNWRKKKEVKLAALETRHRFQLFKAFEWRRLQPGKEKIN